MKTKILIILSFILLCICTPISALASESDTTKIEVESVATGAGTTKDVDISIKNNPGILGCKLTVNYDSRLVLKSANAGEAFSALTLTKPGVLENSCSFVWDAIELSSKDIKDGVILTLTFDVPADAKSDDNFAVDVVCEDAVNTDLSAVSVKNGAGQISIEKKTTVGTLDKLIADKTKTSYVVGEKIALDDIAVTAIYSDGTKKTVSDYKTNVGSIDMSTVGKKTLTVTYTDGGITKTADIEIEVKANESVNNTKIVVSNNLSLPGDHIDVDISVANNPGILGMTLMLQYDSKLTLVSAKSGAAFDMLAMTKPGVLESGCKFVWDGTELDEESIKDGTILTLTFEISKEVKAGEKYIISASSEDAVDMNLNPVKITTQSGSLSIGDDSSIVDNELIGITATKEKVRYEKGSIINLDDLIVVAEYKGGLYKEVKDYTTNVNDIDMSIVGDKILIITYSDLEVTKTASINISVVDKRDNHENHKGYSLVKEIPATCVSDGKKAYYRCNECDRIFEDKEGKKEIEKPIVIPKTGHTYKNIITAATLKNNGYSIKKCTVCQAEYDRDVIYSVKSVNLTKNSFDFNGKTQKPSVVVKDSTGKTVPKTEYNVIYSKDTKSIGKHVVKIVFKNKYSGSIEKYYNIVPVSTKITKMINTSAGIKITWNNKSYDGYRIYRSLNGGGYKLLKNINHNTTNSWIDKNARINGNRYSYVVCPYKVVNGVVYASSKKEKRQGVFLKRGRIVSVGTPSSRKVSIKWGKNSAATGYQVQYSTSKVFTSAKTYTYRKDAIVTASYGKLNKGTTYYFRVRSYKKTTTNIYGEWSAVKSIKVRK